MQKLHMTFVDVGFDISKSFSFLHSLVCRRFLLQIVGKLLILQKKPVINCFCREKAGQSVNWWFILSLGTKLWPCSFGLVCQCVNDTLCHHYNYFSSCKLYRHQNHVTNFSVFSWKRYAINRGVIHDQQLYAKRSD